MIVEVMKRRNEKIPPLRRTSAVRENRIAMQSPVVHFSIFFAKIFPIRIVT
jgi:hypothetical protein